MDATKDGRHLYEVERRAEHAARPPWHFHSNVQDTFYVLSGHLRLFLRDPKEEVRLSSQLAR